MDSKSTETCKIYPASIIDVAINILLWITKGSINNKSLHWFTSIMSDKGWSKYYIKLSYISFTLFCNTRNKTARKFSSRQKYKHRLKIKGNGNTVHFAEDCKNLRESSAYRSSRRQTNHQVYEPRTGHIARRNRPVEPTISSLFQNRIDHTLQTSSRGIHRMAWELKSAGRWETPARKGNLNWCERVARVAKVDCPRRIHANLIF